MRTIRPKHDLLTESQRAMLFKQLAQMDRAGFAHEQMFDMLKAQPDEPIATRVQWALLCLHKGLSVEKSGFQAGLFSEFDRDCLAVAQDTGRYDQIYEHLSTHYSARVLAKRQMRSQMVYPVVVLVVAIFLQPLPQLIAGTLSTSDYVLHTIGVLLWMILLVWAILRSGRWLRFGWLKNFSPILDQMQLSLPGISQWYPRRVLRDFFAQLGLLLSAGMPLFSAWPKASQLVYNRIIQRCIDRVGIALEQGAPFSEALDELPMMDPMLRQFIYSGEHAGSLDVMIQHFVRIESDAIAIDDKFIADWVPRILYGLVVIWVVSGML